MYIIVNTIILILIIVNSLNIINKIDKHYK